jgi:signal transduction histidine kinase/CheY-like chemotaxis protein
MRSVTHALQGNHLVSTIEARDRHRDGHWVWMNSYAVPGPLVADRQSWTLAGYDIGQEREDRERLIQAQRLEGIGILAAGVAHDFNNLLMVISGFADLLADGEARRNILNATDDAAVLVQKLMAFGPSAALEDERCDLVKLVSSLKNVLRSVLGPGIALEVDLGVEGQWVGLSKGQLNQIVLNLVANAKTAIVGKGQVEVSVKKVYLAEGSSDLPAGRYVELIVRDSGVGMDEHTRRHAFDPFFTTKPDKSGSGLGLSSVYGIAHNCGGHVNLESEPGEGTRVKVRLPYAQPRANENDLGLPEVDGTRDGEILVVEDDIIIADLIRKTLAKVGYSVTVRNSTGDALHMLQDEAPDLLITDIMMPDGRGTELAGRLREHWAELPILFISGYSDQQVGDWREAAGEVRFLAKPFRAHELMLRVDQLLPAAT